MSTRTFLDTNGHSHGMCSSEILMDIDGEFYKLTMLPHPTAAHAAVTVHRTTNTQQVRPLLNTIRSRRVITSIHVYVAMANGASDLNPSTVFSASATATWWHVLTESLANETRQITIRADSSWSWQASCPFWHIRTLLDRHARLNCLSSLAQSSYLGHPCTFEMCQ